MTKTTFKLYKYDKTMFKLVKNDKTISFMEEC